MEISRERQQKIDALENKFNTIDQKLDTHLEGLLWQKPITYWDYIQTDALLSLQIQRSTLPDEMGFIMYHQVNELLFKMILREIEQVCHTAQPSTKCFTERVGRISRYFDMLTTSSTVMGVGMEAERYVIFRIRLAPVTGFQSAQYRVIDFASTDLINLRDARCRASRERNTPYEPAYEHLFWQAAGKD